MVYYVFPRLRNYVLLVEPVQIVDDDLIINSGQFRVCGRGRQFTGCLIKLNGGFPGIKLHRNSEKRFKPLRIPGILKFKRHAPGLKTRSEHNLTDFIDTRNLRMRVSIRKL